MHLKIKERNEKRKPDSLFSTDSYDNQLAMGKLDAYLTAAAARVECAERRGRGQGQVRSDKARRIEVAAGWDQ